MARKTFISYKYSESQGVRNNIIEALGDDATYYTGETADSPDLADTSTENVKKNLTDMMYGTSVTIVVISPNIKSSNWIDWEVEYSLKEISRAGRISKTNGVVGVIKEIDGGYDWFVSRSKNADGCTVRNYETSLLYDIINKNRFNRIGKKFLCPACETYNALDDSYISLIDEEVFLNDPDKYIEIAFDKSENADSFTLVKQR